MSAWLIPGPFPPPFDTDERCRITELLNLPESPDASLALAEVAPGVTTRLHAVAGTTECYIMLSGEGLVEVAGDEARLTAGDRVVIPADAPQRITNTGTTPLTFYCLCTPRFHPENYLDLET